MKEKKTIDSQKNAGGRRGKNRGEKKEVLPARLSLEKSPSRAQPTWKDNRKKFRGEKRK